MDNLPAFSQAGRRGFDPRLPLQLLKLARLYSASPLGLRQIERFNVPAAAHHARHGQTTATTVPVPVCPGDGPYPGLVRTTTILGLSPAIVAPDLVTVLDAMTAMTGGTVSGGCELFPGRLIQ